MVLNSMSLESVCTKAFVFKGYFLGVAIAPQMSVCIYGTLRTTGCGED